ncbi:hypothetical protein PMSM_14550 [Paenibacillus macquariensis subsp. macquariensis]|uniref:Uncharacterized protein n=1 Tax=Paenibacillus macquariensis TaxID=948756 RepID=A0ABY1JX38_9BACL|nr:hypothetical protein PMSM_14550 [Paenibacillus macquariensis subsp. macquariensis]SIQ92678.1 hypothetical protein SAMN05421578_10584 [Paenibacillus macquariensis]
MRADKRMNVLSVCFGKSETAILNKSQNLLEIHTVSQAKPIYIASGIKNALKLRDLLNDAYPVEVYSSGKDMRARKRS